MSSTNKTTHYELPQWIGTDKPTFLGDLNGAFLDIDTNLFNANSNAENAVNTANQANTTAGDALTNVTELTETVVKQGEQLSTTTNLANQTAEQLKNIASTTTPSVAFDITTYLSKYSPVVNQNVNYSTVKIGNATFLSIYGVLDISYTGTPSGNDIAATNLIAGTAQFKSAVEQMGTGSRRLNSIGNLIYSIDGTQVSLPIDYRSQQNAILRLGSIQSGTITANSNVTISVQGFLLLGIS